MDKYCGQTRQRTRQTRRFDTQVDGNPVDDDHDKWWEDYKRSAGSESEGLVRSLFTHRYTLDSWHCTQSYHRRLHCFQGRQKRSKFRNIDGSPEICQASDWSVWLSALTECTNSLLKQQCRPSPVST